MHPLDNVIWQVLTTRQAEFAQTFGEARRFVPEVTSLTSFSKPNSEGYTSLARLVGSGGTALLSLASPYEPVPGWGLVLTFPGLQMVCEGGKAMANASVDSPIANPLRSSITELGQRDSSEMVELAALTKPGPFGTRTHELGTYLGIRSEEKLIAMAGERLKVPGYTEVSAVCTHPDHLGRGHAAALMMELMRRIRGRGEKAFLHVRRDNTRAVGLYERLGFVTRMIVHFTVLRKV
jgi:ribosomal protein S18 acetylase RimI-like enzyme